MTMRGNNGKTGKANPYWRSNIRLLAILLSVWFLVSFGAGILFADFLNRFRIFGIELGFWFAQQGAIFVFIILIFIYSRQMRRLEKRHGADRDDTPGGQERAQ